LVQVLGRLIVHRIDSDASVNGLFSAGDPASGQPGTVVSPEWLNAIQEEIAGLIEAMGGTLAKADNTQLAAAVLALLARLNTWTAHQTFNDAIDVNNRLTVTGSDSINGEGNVGVKVRASTAPGSDAPVLLGSKNGNAPFIAAGQDGNGVWHGLDLRTGGLTRIYVEPDGDVSFTGTELKDVATPMSADSAANKEYVDAVPRFVVGGAVNSVGDIINQTGIATVSATHPLTGTYVVTLPGMTPTGIVIVGANGATGPTATAQATAESGQFVVNTYRNNISANVPFSFVVIALTL
jgi:hypothetical protein